MRRNNKRMTALLVVGLLSGATLHAFSGPLTLTRPFISIISPSFIIYVGCRDGPPWSSFAYCITNQFRSIGIDARSISIDWGVWAPRVFNPEPGNEGLTYQEGGWDIFLVGWALSLTPNLTHFFHSQSFVPSGDNYVLWNDSENDILLDALMMTYNDTERFELLGQWQHYFLEESPKAILFYGMTPWVYNPQLLRFEEINYIYPAWGDPGIRWPEGGGIFKTMIGAAIEDYNAIISNSYYDACAWGPVYEPLFYFNSNADLFAYRFTPALAATSYEVSANGLQWNITLREDVYWPTGWQFNASDLMFTLRAICHPDTGAPDFLDFNTAGLVNDNGIGLNESLVWQTGESSIAVRFPRVYSYAKFLLNLVPLSNQALNGTVKANGFSALRSHASNTGEDWTTTSGPDSPAGAGNPIQIHGPLGLGPYDCLQSGTGWQSGGYSVGNFTCKLRGHNGSTTPHDPGYYLENIGHHPDLPAMFETYSAVIYSSWTEAIPALQEGSIDLIDKYLQIQSRLNLIDSAWGTPFVEMDLGLVEMGFNMQHPILGTGLDTPLGRNDSTRAAEAARYVRQALNHLIPREQIIENIMQGFAAPGITFVHPYLTQTDPTPDPFEYNVTKAKELLEQAGYEFVPLPDLRALSLPLIGITVSAVIIIMVWYVWRYVKFRRENL